MRSLKRQKKDGASVAYASALIPEYKKTPHVPEVVTALWKAIWMDWGREVDIEIQVPLVDRTEGELRELKEQGRMMIYVPQKVATQQTRHLLGKIFPEMQSYSVEEGNPVTNKGIEGGWFDVEASLDAPNTNTREADLKKTFKAQGKQGQTVNQYIVGSQFLKLTTGNYFDENTYSRLLGSRYDGGVVGADSLSDGRLNVYCDLNPDGRGERWGGRSSGVKKS